MSRRTARRAGEGGKADRAKHSSAAARHIADMDSLITQCVPTSRSSVFLDASERRAMLGSTQETSLAESPPRVHAKLASSLSPGIRPGPAASPARDPSPKVSADAVEELDKCMDYCPVPLTRPGPVVARQDLHEREMRGKNMLLACYERSGVPTWPASRATVGRVERRASIARQERSRYPIAIQALRAVGTSCAEASRWAGASSAWSTPDQR